MASRRRLLLLGLVLMIPMIAFAQQKQTIGSVFKRMTKPLKAFDGLIIKIAYAAGVGFAIASVFKFKQHKDNPTQVPITNGIALLMIGMLMVFLPNMIAPTAQSMFGTQDLKWSDPEQCLQGSC